MPPISGATDCKNILLESFKACSGALREWCSVVHDENSLRCRVFVYLASFLLIRRKEMQNFGKRASNLKSEFNFTTRSGDDDLFQPDEPTVADAVSIDDTHLSPRTRKRLARRAERVLANLTPARLRAMFSSVGSDEELVVALEHCAETLVTHHRCVAQAFRMYQHLYAGNHGSNLPSQAGGIGAVSQGTYHVNTHISKLHGMSLDAWLQLLEDTGLMPQLATDEAAEIWHQSSAPRGGPLDGGSFAEALVRLAWSQSRATSRPLAGRFDDVISAIRTKTSAINGNDVALKKVATQFHLACKSVEVSLLH